MATRRSAWGRSKVLPVNWLRVFGNAEATHVVHGVRQHLHTRKGRQINAWHPGADRGMGIGVVAACCARARMRQWPRVPRRKSSS